MVKKIQLFILALLVAGLPAVAQAAPANFDRAKVLMRQQVYHDQNVGGALGTFYCGCDWHWVGRSGGRVDLDSCGYQIRAQKNRAERTEWEHIVPASNFGRDRQCWQSGGRSHCVQNDPVFAAMEADMHNLTPAIGEVNADRSNYNFGMLPGTQPQHGACPVAVDFQNRTVEPRDAVKGRIARVYFYMADRYGMSLSRQQERLMMAWHRMYPPDAWEVERDRRIARIMGHHNPFVTGEKQWTAGDRGRATKAQAARPVPHPAAEQEAAQGVIIGNRNSKVYHLPAGCPSYDRVSPSNQVHFDTEQQAVSAGYRKAGNCR
ncbi:MAG: endonuclease [Marinospirillum sp.]|uniref:endonuclease n=1 Tax=Marinospirillum sp. TaxID=2183934 RepID=UPI0019F01555|nr:endonuclease [Marinospirillum sp.]MBE0507253.1 endonuclease [Marinospirillum sp.]